MLGFIAWVIIIWASIQIISSFVLPFMIGRHREPHTPGTASLSMLINISIGVMLLVLAISSLNGAHA